MASRPCLLVALLAACLLLPATAIVSQCSACEAVAEVLQKRLDDESTFDHWTLTSKAE